MTIRYAPVSAGRRFAVHGIARREILIIVLPRIARPIFFCYSDNNIEKNNYLCPVKVPVRGSGLDEKGIR